MMSGVTDGVFAREHPAGPSESGEDFVRNHQHAVAVAQLPDAVEKLARPHDHPARALEHRLDEHRGDLVAAGLQPGLEVAEAVDSARLAPEVHRAAVAVRRVHAVDGEEQGGKRLREDRVFAHRHRADGVAVIRVVERDDPLSRRLALVAPVLHGELHRDFDRRRSVVRVEDAREPGGQHADEPFRQIDRRLVRRAGEDDVFERLRLLGNRLVQPRMRVAVDVHPPRRDAVEQLAAVLGVEIDALAARRWAAAAAPSSSACTDARRTRDRGREGSPHELQQPAVAVELGRRPCAEPARRQRLKAAASRRRPERRRAVRSPPGCPRSADRPSPRRRS